MTEFNLSEMFIWDDLVGETIRVDNVKEFIRLLKEKLSTRLEQMGILQELYYEIDKLAGDKLI